MATLTLPLEPDDCACQEPALPDTVLISPSVERRDEILRVCRVCADGARSIPTLVVLTIAA